MRRRCCGEIACHLHTPVLDMSRESYMRQCIPVSVVMSDAAGAH